MLGTPFPRNGMSPINPLLRPHGCLRRDGVGDGDGDGEAVGAIVGIGVGVNIGVGLGDGLGVGGTIGVGVGSGIGVGVTPGVGVGDGEGVGIGEAVGDGVGVTPGGVGDGVGSGSSRFVKVQVPSGVIGVRSPSTAPSISSNGTSQVALTRSQSPPGVNGPTSKMRNAVRPKSRESAAVIGSATAGTPGAVVVAVRKRICRRSSASSVNTMNSVVPTPPSVIFSIVNFPAGSKTSSNVQIVSS